MSHKKKLTHFSPATGSAVHLLRAPAAAAMQDISETQKDMRSCPEITNPVCGRAWRFSWCFRAQSRMGQGTIVLEEQEENFHIIHFPNLESTSIYTMTILKPLMETNPLNWITMNNIVKGFVTVTEETVLLLFNVSQHIETTQETVYFSAWRCV